MSPQTLLRAGFELAQSLDNLERKCGEIDQQMKLYGPIARKLMPMTFNIAKQGWPLGGWTIHLCIEDFPDQFKSGINLCLGVDITWFTRIWRCPMLAHKHDMDLRILGIEWRRA
jgi:hypothetical protein